MTADSSLASRTVRRLARTIFPASASQSVDPNCTYDHDYLKVWHKNTEFMREPQFVESYQRGMNSGHKMGRASGSNVDTHVEWRVHIGCWAASHAKLLPGDFVECGVNTGIMSLSVCDYIDFNSLDKDFYLFDTFQGIPVEQMTDEEKAAGREQENVDYYEECYDLVKGNFAPFPRATLVRGAVPGTLNHVSIEEVCYLSIDMNIVAPEMAAIEHFWPRLVSGGIVLLDDYGWLPHADQKTAMDAFAEQHGVKVLTLPTGQGLILKP